MTMPKGYQFVGLKRYPNSIVYAPLINSWCQLYKVNGIPMDARLIATLIQTEDSSWSPTARGGQGSVGLSQMIPSTGSLYGLNTYSDKINPSKSIKALCSLFSRCLSNTKGNIGGDNAKRAYEEYNGGFGVFSSNDTIGLSQAIGHVKQNWNPAYSIWFNTSCIAPINGKGGKPNMTNNNTNSTLDAIKAKNALLQNEKIKAQQNANALQKSNAIKANEQLKQAKLTKDPKKIKQAQNQVNASKATIKPVSSKLPSNGLKMGGFGLIGVVAMLIFLRFGYDL
jgi:hypothetical protein